MNTQTIYLLCIWSEAPIDDDGVPLWRAIVEEPRTGRQWGFSDPRALVAFLEKERGSQQQRVSESTSDE